MQNYLWDGIKRDRLVWIGDMHAETSAIMGVFGYNEVVEKSLDLIKNVYSPDEWMNGIPSYTFWWLIIRSEWYMYTGNVEYVMNDAGYIRLMTLHILDSISADGSDSFKSSLESGETNNPYASFFIDWETYGTPDSKSGFYAVAVMALTAAKNLCTVIGDSVLAARCIQIIKEIYSFDLPETKNKQVAALRVLAGMDSAIETNKRILSRKPVTDITAYLGYYVLLAKGKAGDVSGALDIIRRYWGRMLELGATSFWESFDYSEAQGASRIDEILPSGKTDIHGDFGAYCYKGFRKSLCHGWACGPTPFITRYVLGVEVVKHGCRAVKIAPNLGDLKWIEGAYPTPYGNIEIYAENKNGEIKTSINAPKEVEII